MDLQRVCISHAFCMSFILTYLFSLKRDGNGRFSDADIANILQDSTSYRAGAFRARGIPEALRVIEILGIEQARGWGACSVCFTFRSTDHGFSSLYFYS